jgi:hypothetical protein
VYVAEEDTMNDDNTNAQHQPPTPSPDLGGLDRLVGTWKVSGGAQGRVTYEWMEGGFFLLQHVELEQYGQRIKGMEVIGTNGRSAASRARTSSPGSTTIWATPSTMCMSWTATPLPSGAARRAPRPTTRGTFSQDGNTISGAWVYPDDGGYESTSSRVES